MHFICYATDKPDHGQIRLDTREKHLDWISKHKILLAGPRLDQNENMIGSLLVLEAKNLDEAVEIFGTDPYLEAGLFASTEISPWRWVVGKPENN